MRDGLSRPSREYAQQLMMSGGHSLFSAIVVEAREVKTCVKLQKDGEPNEGVEFEAVSPTVTKGLIQIQELSHTAAEHAGLPSIEAEAVSKRVKSKMEECLINEGVMTGQSSRKSAEDVVKNIVTQELNIPKSMGCLPLHGVECYQEAASYQFVWHMLWTDGEDEITTELRLDRRDLAMDFMKVRERLQGQLEEKLALLRMQYPGDFEVECVDATGMEHCFDEGMAYLAEEHNEDGMVWVYDRCGEKGEYMMERFTRVQKVKLKNREAPAPPEEIDSFDGDFAWIKSGDTWEKRWDSVEDLMNFPVSDNFDGHTNKESVL